MIRVCVLIKEKNNWKRNEIQGRRMSNIPENINKQEQENVWLWIEAKGISMLFAKLIKICLSRLSIVTKFGVYQVYISFLCVYFLISCCSLLKLSIVFPVHFFLFKLTKSDF